jgi:hypothetical protein
MSKPIHVLMLALVLATFMNRPASSQSSQSDQPTDGPADNADSAIDEAAAELRELICSRAADFSHQSQEQSIALVVRRDYHDERFDAPIRRILKESAQTDQWEAEKIQRAIMLIPFSSLDPKELTGFIFACYFQCDGKNADINLARDLKKHLSRYPDQTSRLLKEKMGNDGVTGKLIPLVQIVGKSSEEMLPMLLEACRSDDRALAEAAVSTVDTLIQQLRRNKQNRSLAQALDVQELDPKFIAYSQRIVSRYDKDQDKVLSADEWEKMLMSPADADKDKDHLITVEEYAAWMQARTKRN